MQTFPDRHRDWVEKAVYVHEHVHVDVNVDVLVDVHGFHFTTNRNKFAAILRASIFELLDVGSHSW